MKVRIERWAHSCKHNSKEETTHENLTLWREFRSCQPRSHTPASARLTSLTSFTKGFTCPHAGGPHLLRTLLCLYNFSHAWGISMICPVVTSNSCCPKLFVTSHTDLPSALLFLSADLKFLLLNRLMVIKGRWGGMGWIGNLQVVDANYSMNG